MSLATNITTAFTRVGTEFKAIRILISGSGTGTVSGLTTTATNLVGAINEVKALVGAGSPTTLTDLTDVTITSPAVGQMLRHDGAGQFVNVDPTTYLQPRDSDLDAIAALATTAFGRALLALADATALAGQVAGGTESLAGVLEIATQTEVNTGTDDVRAVTALKLATRLAAFAQPLDSDLTAIAALATTAYGRGLLTLADAAALTAALNNGTTALKGALQLATTAENQTGSDTTKASTPAGVKAAIDQRIDNTAGLTSGSTTNAPSVAAVKAYADGIIAAADAMVFKGVIDASANPNYPAANRGDTYRISVAGRIGGASGPVVEVGDLILCITDGTAAGNHATVGANWNITQTNIDGAVTGPTSATSGNLASFSGTGGKVVADSGFSPSNAAIGAGSATILPTSAQVVAYAQPLDADLTAIAGLTSAADRLPYFTGWGTASLATFTAFGRSLVDDTDATAGRTTLGLGNVDNTSDANKPISTATQTALNGKQPLDTDLTAIAALVSAADQVPYATGAGTWALFTATTFGRGLVGSVDAAAGRTALSVYSQTEIGNPETDFAAAFVAALA